ncbi:13851_t:CDS:2 [Acaulospora colombiana]|uniref:13851_t:CDS:1 n=1 Tax=Acaulospora colombiana TaxID=27376 RepID=A0ACA9LWZ5_9GLOM|nr:13851_t:CDS:2 [Acaulospora colombiana]
MSHRREELEIIVHPPSPSLKSNASESDPDISPSSPRNNLFSQDQRGIPDGRETTTTSPETSTSLLADNMSTQTVQNEKERGCYSVTYHKVRRIIEILTWMRIGVALLLYLLIVVDIIHISKKKEKKYWVEVLTQLTNAEFTLLTIIMHPKRIINFLRATQIWWSVTNNTSHKKVESRKYDISQVEKSADHLQDTNSYQPQDHIRDLQKKVHESYYWYTYEGCFLEEIRNLW